MTPAITSVAIGHERDIVIARRRACEIARQLHLTVREGTRLGTAVSEIARNALAYAGGGKVEFLLDQEGARSLVVRVSDRGPGIAKPDEVLSGRSRSHSGLGLGIAGARRLVDGFELNSQPGVGTTVVLKKLLNHTASRTEPSPAEIGERVSRKPYDVYDEVQQQNQELTNTLAELSQRQDDLARLNRELEETNRGVVALYAELDERAEHLRQADAMKSRFLSHLSHEFRTPLNGIVGLTRLLLNEPGQSDEAIKQIRYIQRSAEDLTELVNDLLDIAKAEAGKLTVHANQFDVSNVFSALRGVFRALSAGESVALIFDEPESMPVLQTDESKVSQIVRNFISNALKFTERGEVRVSTAYDATRDEVVFSVSDTGIGIAPEHRQRIFEEFAQIDSAVQRRVKGTGYLTSLPEITGDAALLFDPRRPAEIVAAIERLETDPLLRAGLIERGRRRVAAFITPEEWASRFFAVFQDAADHPAEHPSAVYGVFPDGWTGGRLTVVFGRGQTPRRLAITLHAPEWLPSAEVVLRVGAKSHRIPRGQRKTLTLDLPGQSGVVELLCSPTFQPGGEDLRQLGCLLESAAIVGPEGETGSRQLPREAHAA